MGISLTQEEFSKRFAERAQLLRLAVKSDVVKILVPKLPVDTITPDLVEALVKGVDYLLAMEVARTVYQVYKED
jgi:hypothetical protein